MTRQRILLALFLVFFATVVGVGVHYIRQPGSELHLRLATGASGGTYHAMGRGIKAAIEGRWPQLRVDLIPTAGSEANADLLREGGADLAFLQAPAKPEPRIACVGNLYDEVLQVVVRAEDSVQHLNDLQGGRLFVGADDSGTEQVARLVLRHYGLGEADFTAEHGDFKRAVAMLLADEIDAAFIVAGIPTAALDGIADPGRVRFVSVGQREALSTRYHFVHESVIPLGLYDGAAPLPAYDVATVGVSSALVVRTSLDEGTVWRVTEALFAGREEIIAEGHMRGADISEGYAQAKPVVPLHTGAQAFYDRDKPPIASGQSEFIGMVISLAVPLAGMFFTGVRWIALRKKDRMRHYYELLDRWLRRARAASNPHDLEDCRKELIDLKRRATRELITNDVKPDEAYLIFHREFEFCFRFIMSKVGDRGV